MSDSLQKETDKKKQESRAIRKKEKVLSSEMELMVCQLTTIVRNLEEHEFLNTVEVLGEDWNDGIDGVIVNMICLAETAQGSRVPEEHKPFWKTKKERGEKYQQRSMLDSFVNTWIYKEYFLRIQRLRDERTFETRP